MQKNSYLPTFHNCIVCGQRTKNPASMNVRFQVTDHGVKVPFTPDSRQEGFKGICHGGILCSLLDETIGWAVAVDRKRFFITMELNVRFVASLPIGTKVTVYGRAVEHKSRLSIAEGEIIDDHGKIYAKATGKFYPLPDEKSTDINKYLTFMDDDVDILAEKK